MVIASISGTLNVDIILKLDSNHVIGSAVPIGVRVCLHLHKWVDMGVADAVLG